MRVSQTSWPYEPHTKILIWPRATRHTPLYTSVGSVRVFYFYWVLLKNFHFYSVSIESFLGKLFIFSCVSASIWPRATLELLHMAREPRFGHPSIKSTNELWVTLNVLKKLILNFNKYFIQIYGLSNANTLSNKTYKRHVKNFISSLLAFNQ
jgi:hypothetical protein